MEKFVYYKNGIYLVVEREEITREEFEKDENIIVGYINWIDIPLRGSLYGGRVKLKADYSNSGYLNIYIDGIEIVDNDGDTRMSVERLVGYLNAIEANGVDAFLKNYKESLNSYYNELKATLNDFNNLDTSALSEYQRKNIISAFATRIEKIPKILGIIVLLNIWMPAALDNEKVIETHESIIESIS